MTDLDQMLSELTVTQREHAYVYVVVPDLSDAIALDAAAIIQEAEGITAVIPKHSANRNHLHYDYEAAWLTLEIHSALDAVGLTAAFSQALAAVGISCNVLAGYHHDHILVAAPDAEVAVATLRALADNHPAA